MTIDEAARKVADAAVEYEKAKAAYDESLLDGIVVNESDDLLFAHGFLIFAVREYRECCKSVADKKEGVTETPSTVRLTG
jgi:hypothetical protein